MPYDKIFLELTEANLEDQYRNVKKDKVYGKEKQIIHDVLTLYPRNDDLNIVAMKIALIDVTNSTHLSQQKSFLSLYDLADHILRIQDFDKRIEEGDPELVNEIARNGRRNIFSFASKYCTYHNNELYKRDDYSIFDGIVRDILPHYKKDLTKNKLENWRKNFNYKAFNDCISTCLDEYDIHISERRRKLDYFLWYLNKDN